MSRKSKLADLMEAVQTSQATDNKANNQSGPVDRIQRIELERIYVNPTQHRKYFDPEEQQKLQNAIQQNGFQGAILLRHLPEEMEDAVDSDFDFELVYGESRIRAVRTLGWESIPAVIKNLNDREVHRIRLDENLVRKDLNPLEEMDGLLEVAADELEVQPAEVLSLLDEVENATRRNTTLKGDTTLLAEKLQGVLDYYNKGSLSGFRTKYRKLQRLPDDIKAAVQKSLDWSKAVEIKPIKDPKERQRVLKWAIQNNPSIKEIRQRRKKIKLKNANDLKPSKDSSNLKKKFYKGIASVTESKTWHDPEQQKHIQQLITRVEEIFNIDIL